MIFLGLVFGIGFSDMLGGRMDWIRRIEKMIGCLIIHNDTLELERMYDRSMNIRHAECLLFIQPRICLPWLYKSSTYNYSVESSA